MHAHRIDIFHRTDGDHVAHGIAHDFKFDFLPTGDGFFNQHLRDGRCIQPHLRDGAQFLPIGSRAAARAAERKGGAHDDRITDLFRDFQRLIDRIGNSGGNHGFADGFHGVLEQLTILRLINRLRVRADQTDAVLIKEAILR